METKEQNKQNRNNKLIDTENVLMVVRQELVVAVGEKVEGMKMYKLPVKKTVLTGL